MPGKILHWLQLRFPFLFEDKMPVWLTIVASVFAGVAAAAGTYLIAPAINRQYQVDEARAAHISRTTLALNSEVIALSQGVRRLNEALVNRQADVPKAKDECLDLVTKLQWMLVDLNVVLKSENDRKALSELSRSIDDVKQALDRSVDASAQPELLRAMRTLGQQTREVLDRLYVAASLK